MSSEVPDFERIIRVLTAHGIEGRRVRVLSPKQLIETKTRAGWPKDDAALPLVRHALEEKRRER